MQGINFCPMSTLAHLSWAFHESPIEAPRETRGILTGVPWGSHGSFVDPTGSPWQSHHGSSMEFLTLGQAGSILFRGAGCVSVEVPHGSLMDNVWGSRMDNSWGNPRRHPREVGYSRGVPWDNMALSEFHERSARKHYRPFKGPLKFHGKSMGVPRETLGRSITEYWRPMRGQWEPYKPLGAPCACPSTFQGYMRDPCKRYRLMENPCMSHVSSIRLPWTRK